MSHKMGLFKVIFKYCEMLSHNLLEVMRAVNLTITHVLHAIGLEKSLHVSALSWEKKEEGEVEVSSTSEVP